METEKTETTCSTNTSDLQGACEMNTGNMIEARELPNGISEASEAKPGDLSDNAFELLAVECYRSGLVPPEELHRLLSLRRGPA